MSRIKSKDTKPEMVIRRLVHSLGYRFRLHRKDLPGKPDLVFPSRKKIIFINGCYWHMHTCKYGAVVPKTNTEFWQTKRQSNVDRDIRNVAQLKEMGWEVFTVWECETKDIKQLTVKVVDFLDDPPI
ncbi:DNA mismatch endonuclease Vsr [Rufibacter immobilis]|uniref:DNA mismatch endonuclease Vsr n=1 Tax=Rufibacter immobilis TaxID=1348778 RepID=A0A3M9N5G6_9BACT|nr:very short patch repair endonuclease [Rufibacter immobilis]RNI32238.1 DNA mismatch endonuclease Vsr [Rufibacter immobilis]